MSESTKFQVNFKTPKGTLINFYAETILDGVAQLNEFAGAWPVIQAIEAAMHPAAAAAAPVAPPVAPVVQFPSEPAWGGPAAAPAAVAPAPAAPAPGAHMCRHGAMTHRTGTSAKGPWTGYFCPQPKGAPDQCEPQFVR